MKYYLLSILFVLVSTISFAQDEFYHPELEWKSIETEHFYVHYHDGAERTARVVAKAAEEIYEPVTSLYNHKPDSKVSFIIKDYDDYSNGAAYFYDNKVEIWASSLDFDLRGAHNWLRNVVTHEFTHIVQIQTSMKFGRRVPGVYFQWLGYESERRSDVLYGYPNVVVSYPFSGFVVPSWFAEGVAQYNRPELRYDSWDTHRDMILRMYALDNNMLTWTEMSVFGKTSLGNESSYNAGFAFVHYIADTYGEDKIREISYNLSSLTEVTIDGAIQRAIGKSGQQVYDEWKKHLQKEYTARVAPIKQSEIAGEIIGKVGFANFYPAFSPDGKKLAYISNKESDYFSQSSIYLYDLETKKEKLIKSAVRASFSWSPDGKKMYYSRITRDNPHWSNLYDVYVYDIEREDETRLTHGLRANSPSVSPDGKSIVFVAGSDGTLNVFRMNIDGSNVIQLTHYTQGEQVYSPKWSHDGKTIVFDYSIKDGRDIATISANGGEATFLVATPDDERNAVFTSDGNSIIYASDKTGIFNLYKYNFQTQATEQITNVLGGTFMPTMNSGGKIAFASYTSSGYKLAMLNNAAPMQQAPSYQPPSGPIAEANSIKGTDGTTQFNWEKLRSYDDTKLSSDSSTIYKSVNTSLTIVPFLRVDNYNRKNKGIDLFKPGAYLFSYDVLDKYGFFAGAAINRKWERDLFVTFDYRGRVPGLYQLGMEPAVSLEAYNLTRKTESFISLPLDTIGVEITYNLLEFDFVLRQKFLHEALDLEIRYAHSRYNADVGSFTLIDPAGVNPPILVQSFGNLYLVGNDLSATFKFENIAPSRTMEINPVGRKIKLSYHYEFNKFQARDSSGASLYEVKDGLYLPLYDRPRFHRIDASWREHVALPGWRHTLSLQLRGGSILGPPVDDFFDFYVGGLAGMKGYPFYSLGGNEFAYANLTYRFPVIEHIDLRLWQIYFDKLYAAVYGDVGNAWTGGGLSGQKFKRDAGVELRLEAFSYYAYPTRIFFNATYGFDQFDRYVSNDQSTVTYGKEWSFHFGVLFGFDLD